MGLDPHVASWITVVDVEEDMVGEVARLSHTSVRTLHHYDAIGLVVPGGRSAAGYRLYSDADLERLRQVLSYRELGFSLEEIAEILANPDARADPMTTCAAIIACCATGRTKPRRCSAPSRTRWRHDRWELHSPPPSSSRSSAPSTSPGGHERPAGAPAGDQRPLNLLPRILS